MKIKFTLAGGLLVIAGLLQLATLVSTPFDASGSLPWIFSLALGAVYIVLGVMLLRLKDTYLTSTALIVLFGLIVDIGSNANGVEGIKTIVMVVEALALVVLAYLYLQSRAPLSRVQ